MWRALSALLAVGLLAVGCADEADETPAPAPEIGSPRALATAQRLVDRHWRAVIDGDAALPLFYDDRVLRSIPAGELGAAIYSGNVHLAVRPRVVAVERTQLGLSITTESRPGSAPPIRAGYLVRRIGTDWKILYDSNLAQSLDRQARAARRLRNPQLAARGSEALDPPYLRLRELYLPGRSGGRLVR